MHHWKLSPGPCFSSWIIGWIDLFIQFCLQNNGKLSERKRSAHFDFLTDEELADMEQAVKDGYKKTEL